MNLALATTVVLASFVSPPNIQQKYNVSGLELSGKAVEEVLEHSEHLDDAHLEYDELLSESRNILKDPHLQSLYRSEMSHLKREFQIHKNKTGLVFEELQKHNEISFGQGDRGPEVRLKLVHKFRIKPDNSLSFYFSHHKAYRDQEGLVHVDTVPSSDEFATEISE